MQGLCHIGSIYRPFPTPSSESWHTVWKQLLLRPVETACWPRS